MYKLDPKNKYTYLIVSKREDRSYETVIGAFFMYEGLINFLMSNPPKKDFRVLAVEDSWERYENVVVNKEFSMGNIYDREDIDVFDVGNTGTLNVPDGTVTLSGAKTEVYYLSDVAPYISLVDKKMESMDEYTQRMEAKRYEQRMMDAQEDVMSGEVKTEDEYCSYPEEYTKTIEWLYTNDKAHSSAAKWREAFVLFLKELYDIKN